METDSHQPQPELRKRVPLFGDHTETLKCDEASAKTALLFAVIASLSAIPLAFLVPLGSEFPHLLLTVIALFHVVLAACIGRLAWRSTSRHLNAWGIRVLYTAGKLVLWLGLYAVMTMVGTTFCVIIVGTIAVSFGLG